MVKIGKPSKALSSLQSWLQTGNLKPSSTQQQHDNNSDSDTTLDPTTNKNISTPLDASSHSLEDTNISASLDISPEWQDIANETREHLIHRGCETEESSSKKSSYHKGIIGETILKINNTDSENLVREGILWEYPREILHSSTVCTNLNNAYKHFFIPRIFHWRPDLLIPNWRPKCGSCGCSKNMNKHGKNNPPRIIYDSHDNYILHAPTRYHCTACSFTSSNEKLFNHVPRKKRTKYTWLSTDEAILEQIRLEHPDIYEMFPCHLTHRAGIDKKLMDSITVSAMKGIGPNAMADIIRENHFRTWQKNEIQWLGYLARRKRQPLPSDHMFDFSKITKCPSYCSDEIGGRVPSGNWLVAIFCTIVGRRRKYLDAECIARLRSSKLFALDASYKVTNWIMRWGGVKLFDALESAVNEYGETILQHFENSDSHQQLEPVLKTLFGYGLDPSFAFTDVPDRDAHFLEEIFPSLKNGIIELDPEGNLNADNLPLLPFRNDIKHSDTNDNAIAALNLLLESLDAAPASERIVGFDTENPVLSNGVSEKISVIQLAADCMDDVIVIHIGRISSPLTTINKLKTLFLREDIAFVGNQINGDITGIKKDFPQFHGCFKNVIDVGVMARDRNLVKPGPNQSTLSALTKNYLKYHLPKPSHIRRGTVVSGRNKLPQEAINYCARDAEAPLRLYYIFKEIPNCKIRFKKGEEMKVGMKVHIMPQGRKADLKPIARGTIVKVDGNNPGFNLKLSKTNRVLVQVKKEHLYQRDAIVHFPFNHQSVARCKCKRSEHGILRDMCDIRCYEDIAAGHDSFDVVESYHRLRPINDDNAQDDDSITSNNDHVNSITTTSNHEDDKDVPTPHMTCQVTSNNAVDDSDDDSSDNGNDGDDDKSISDDGSLLLEPAAMEELDTLIDEIEGDAAGSATSSGISEHLVDDTSPTHDDIFSPSTSVGNDVTFNDTNTMSEATIEQVAAVSELDSTVDKIISECQDFVDDIRSQYSTNTNCMRMWTRVLGDAFHLMDRVKVPINHVFKASYFQALRSAMFIFDKDDEERVKRVVEQKNQKWDQVKAFNFRYIALRVKRIIPPPKVLHSRLKAVFDFFADKIDPSTNQPLFNNNARKKSKLVLEAVLKGHFSDPPGWNWYVPKTDKYGNVMVDDDGLPLYRSLRGTNLTESMHQNLTRSFGHTFSGPEYSDCILALLRHHQNWAASERNRPDFPHVGHCDGLAIDTVNTFYEELFGSPKYSNWYSCMSLNIKHSPYGVVPLQRQFHTTCDGISPTNMSLQIVGGLSRTMQYLATRQNSEVPFAPVKGKFEKQLFSKLVSDLLREKHVFSASKTFIEMAKRWNCLAKGSNGIMKKDPEHLVQYYKSWKKTRARKDAIESTQLPSLNAALQFNSTLSLTSRAAEIIQPILNCKPTAITTNTSIETSTVQCIPIQHAAANNIQPICPPQHKQTRQRKRCKNLNCPDRDQCNGGYNREKCLSMKIAHKRKSPIYRNPRRSPTCSVPGCTLNRSACPGRFVRKNCSSFLSNNAES